MSKVKTPAGMVRIDCVCGGEVRLDPHLLGHVIPCPHCGRYLRPALQFLLVDQSLAPNLTVQCTCGRFLVDSPDKVGKRVRCKMCKSHLMMPQPVVKFNREGIVRVPRKVLQNQLTRAQQRQERAPKELTRLESAAHRGRITLGPGEHICANPECGALLRPNAIVCHRCGVNRLSGQRYHGKGPDEDPVGDWREV